MPRKKSVKKAATDFILAADVLEVSMYDPVIRAAMSDQETTWWFEYGIIRLYREFEGMILTALVGAINNNTEVLSKTTGVDFPKHLTDEVCEYIVTGGGYFDFKGRSGLIKTLKKVLPNDHYLVEIVRKTTYVQSLERLVALRNFAAHDSPRSKAAALTATDCKRMASAGAWLKKQGRWRTIATRLRTLANEINQEAPF